MTAPAASAILESLEDKKQMRIFERREVAVSHDRYAREEEPDPVY